MGDKEIAWVVITSSSRSLEERAEKAVGDLEERQAVRPGLGPGGLWCLLGKSAAQDRPAPARSSTKELWPLGSGEV